MFFCYRYGDHRDLHVLTHAFPTRRSSDLLLDAQAFKGRADQVGMKSGGRTVFSAKAPWLAIVNADGDLVVLQNVVFGIRMGSRSRADRKSTRLNSSH